MLQPKRSKHRKMQKGRMKGDAKRGFTIAFGSYGLKALDQHWITDRQIEAARQALTREMKREGNVWIRIFPDKPITSKPAEVRMGKGKGNLEFWAAVVKPGRILFEVDGVDEKVARASLNAGCRQAAYQNKIYHTQGSGNCIIILKINSINKMSKKADFVKSIHGMNENDLKARLEEDKQRLKKLEFAHTISPLENPMTIRGLRRDVARLKTELKKQKLILRAES